MIFTSPMQNSDGSPSPGNSTKVQAIAKKFDLETAWAIDGDCSVGQIVRHPDHVAGIMAPESWRYGVE
jgi:hypothetical protein